MNSSFFSSELIYHRFKKNNKKNASLFNVFFSNQCTLMVKSSEFPIFFFPQNRNGRYSKNHKQTKT